MTDTGPCSSTLAIPEVGEVPRHVAIIMDGNGRWAKSRMLPRVAGHTKGVARVREIVEACVLRGIAHLTLFAFSSENWRRPAEEVDKLMELFVQALEREVSRLHHNGIRLRIIGDKARFPARLQHLIRESEQLTAGNGRLTLTVAANYGGRWDILQAFNAWLHDHPHATQISEAAFAPYLSMADAPEPDLFIRTGGEQRISNFLLWQLAYTELYFTPVLWPDFDAAELDRAIAWYRQRERRFGRTSEQLRSG
ncbi:MAG: polyprenyl diphosphate synthase [Thiobacillaceae bacterium]|nr:polyprenyl diphosphate synthase [Thiobacillaceae bacterium]